MPSRGDLTELLIVLADSCVDFILVGGLAAVAQGVPISTFDVDIVHKRSDENVRKIIELLPALDSKIRGHPDTSLLPGKNALCGPGHQLLMTRFGALDFLGAIEQGLTYEDLLNDSLEIDLNERKVLILGLTKLAELKSTSTRPKDRLQLQLIQKTLLLKGNSHR